MTVYLGGIAGTPVSLTDVAKEKGLMVAKVRYSFQGLKKLTGYVLVDSDRNEIVEIEPSFSKSYKWSAVIHERGGGMIRGNFKTMSSLVSALKKYDIGSYRTGFKFTGKI